MPNVDYNVDCNVGPEMIHHRIIVKINSGPIIYQQ